jgi:hypothetical protein
VNFLIASVFVVAISIFGLVLGVLRWTGRLRRWADPNQPNIPEIFLWGRSPLTLILMSIVILSGVACAFALNWSLSVATAILLLAMMPAFVLVFVIRIFRPTWADPPWLTSEDWDQSVPKLHPPKGPKPNGHPGRGS